jgi:hypothetical protein
VKPEMGRTSGLCLLVGSGYSRPFGGSDLVNADGSDRCGPPQNSGFLGNNSARRAYPNIMQTCGVAVEEDVGTRRWERGRCGDIGTRGRENRNIAVGNSKPVAARGVAAVRRQKNATFCWRYGRRRYIYANRCILGKRCKSLSRWGLQDFERKPAAQPANATFRVSFGACCTGLRDSRKCKSCT